ncbi:hypothetical protein H6G80_32475 [Nostoc sp. FACHB-87]|uniref:hypothetical protein n=1 Tax=Nostocaceae TaxID=1162 RepID=UPI00168846EF|nr:MULTISPECIES: hypothetical protein [Nostocaceae]MBD2458763.1 hypothetical protein [Nostoc sp. FACHB-87]MBD2479817.1 hypothetical protein [Anabaena sp. FACHB-83]
MPQATTTEQLTSVEIDFYEHEIYCGQKLIARIIYDHNDLTQPWVVEVNNQEVFRRAWWQKSFDDICWHYKKGTLPVQQQETPAATTGNEMMVRVAEACENLGYELLDDGIYYNDIRLVEIVYRDGIPCFVQTLAHQPAVKSSSLDLLDKHFDELLTDEWRMLQEYEPVQDLAA